MISIAGRGKADNVVFGKRSDVRTFECIEGYFKFQTAISKDSPCSCGSPLTTVECCHGTALDGVIWSYFHQEEPVGCECCPCCIALPCLTEVQQVGNPLELIKTSRKDDPENQKMDERFASAGLGEDVVLVGGVQQDESSMG